MLRPTIRSHSAVLIALALLASLLAGPGSTTAQAAIERENGVAYGEAGGLPLLLDVYRPSSRAALLPGVILVSYGPRGAMSGPAVKLAHAGYIAVAVEYPLLWDEPWPAQLDTGQRAVRWVRAHAAEYGLDPDRLCSYGFSAGAHLASMLGVRETRDNSDPELAPFSSRVDCVIDLAGDSDLSLPYLYPSFTEEAIAWLGGPVEEMPGRYRDASPVFHVDENSAPFLVIHGAADSLVPVEHSRRMVAALQEAGVEVVYVELPRASHSEVSSWDVSGPWMLTFLERHLQLDS